MKCYVITNQERKDAVFIPDKELYILKTECPEDKIKEGSEIICNMEITRNEFWTCVAASDSGIDANRSNDIRIPIDFEMLVSDGEHFIGVFLSQENNILLFDDNDKSRITVITNEEFVGGWGDVTEGYSYCLSKKEQ